MGLCIRPFGVLIAGDRECHERHDAIRQQNQEEKVQRIYARSYGDGETAFEGVVGDAFGFLGGVVENDPFSQLFGALGGALGGKKDPVTGAVDPTPMLLVGAGVTVAAVVFLTHKGKGHAR